MKCYLTNPGHRQYTETESKRTGGSCGDQAGKGQVKLNLANFYRTQVSLGSDLWVRFSETDKLYLCASYTSYTNYTSYRLYTETVTVSTLED